MNVGNATYTAFVSESTPEATYLMLGFNPILWEVYYALNSATDAERQKVFGADIAQTTMPAQLDYRELRGDGTTTTNLITQVASGSGAVLPYAGGDYFDGTSIVGVSGNHKVYDINDNAWGADQTGQLTQAGLIIATDLQAGDEINLIRAYRRYGQ